MIAKNDFPILEFDTEKVAKLNPSNFADKKFDADKMVITFFPEIIKKLIASGEIEPYYEIGGEAPFTIYKYVKDPDVLIVHGQVGCPACAGNLDLFYGFGIKKVMFCGGGGVLDRNIKVGQLLLVDGAIRDEGFSYHYVEPSRYIYTDKKLTDKIASYLEKSSIPYLRGIVWTTDALFRETSEKIALRKEEGAKIVEMEQAGCIAVAQFRGLDYGAIIYGGDDVASEEWNHRGWNNREGIRFNLVMLCKELVKEM
ncbi:MAG: nucleoside phosphorylase [Spirochaetaceae bacterium]|nr:nucleoside phosphorylase [Spirochaetaceae bacterium]